MNVLIIYATNSGGTEICSKVIKESLEKEGLNNTVTLKKALLTMPKDLSDYDLILFGTPTWFFGAKGGVPHEDIMNLFNRLEAAHFNSASRSNEYDLSKTKYGVFGCGDKSYTFFCRAVDAVEELLRNKGVSVALESLKIDSFFFDMDKNIDQVEKWAEKLAKLN